MTRLLATSGPALPVRPAWWVRTEHGHGSLVLELPTVKRVRRIDRDHRFSHSGGSYAEELIDAVLPPRTGLVRWGEEVPTEEIAEALRLVQRSVAPVAQR